MLIQILQYIVVIGTILAGFISLFWPKKVLSFTGLDVVGGRGITEIRTVLGALFIGLGAAALVFNMPATYQMLGITYLAMALVRGLSIFVDKSVTSSNVISFAAELVFGIILVL